MRSLDTAVALSVGATFGAGFVILGVSAGLVAGALEGTVAFASYTLKGLRFGHRCWHEARMSVGSATETVDLRG